MTNTGLNLKEQLAELHYLAWLQRGLRLGLRALWLGGAGFLLGWGIHALWGWLPSVRYWLLAGMFFALIPLYGLAFSLSGRKRWVWTMDRRLGLKEQVSTAWEVLQSGEPDEMSEALVADVLRVIPRVRRRMLNRGWFLERDLVAAAIVFCLGALVLISTQMDALSAAIAQNPLASNPPIEQPEPFPEMLSPPLPPDPSGERSENPQANPGGSQEEGGGTPDGSLQGEGGSPEGSPSSGDQPGSSGETSPNLDPGALGDALQDLGSDLSQQAPTYDLGQSLQDLDLDGAAGELEELTDQLDELSPETRERMADAMREAAGEAGAAGDPSLSQDLEGAADALQGNRGIGKQGSGGAGEALDQLAQELRELGQEMQQAQANGSGAGGGSSAQTGNPEPAERLQGEGGDMELPLEDSSQSGLLSPAPPQEDGNGNASGSLDNTSQSGEDIIHSPLLPNSFLWKWRDVVSSYFQR
jgi:hypothetical protein